MMTGGASRALCNRRACYGNPDFHSGNPSTLPLVMTITCHRPEKLHTSMNIHLELAPA
jgi:hypothetical protein